MRLPKFQISLISVFLLFGIGYSQNILNIAKMIDIYNNEAIELKNFNHTLLNEICEYKNCSSVNPKASDTTLVSSKKYHELIERYSASHLVITEYRRYGGRYHLNISLYNQRGEKITSHSIRNLDLSVGPEFYDELRKIIWKENYTSYYFENEMYSENQQKSRFIVKLGQLYPDGSGFKAKRFRERERLNESDSSYYFDTTYVGDVYSDFNFQMEYRYRVNRNDELGVSLSILSGVSSLIGLNYHRTIVRFGIVSVQVGLTIGFAFLDDDQIDVSYYYGPDDLSTSDENNGIFILPTFELNLLENESISFVVEGGYVSSFGQKDNNYAYVTSLGLAKNF